MTFIPIFLMLSENILCWLYAVNNDDGKQEACS